MTKKEVIAILEEQKVEFDPDATKAELEKLIVPDAKAARAKAKEAGDGSMTAVPDSVVRKIEKDEIISLQKEGKLVKHDSRTGMGVVLNKGTATRWPV